jgi:hypothetical protein
MTPAGADPQRFELVGFPILGGNSDIGFQFGAAGTLTRYCGQVEPYLWTINLVLSGSVKDDSNGLRFVQQYHIIRIDAPDLFNGRMRLDTFATYQRTVNEGYFGPGDASRAPLPPSQKSFGDYYEYLQNEPRLRFISRVHNSSPVDFVFGGNFRWELGSAYPGSKLAQDLANRVVTGGSSMGLGGLAVGVVYDTRDTEFVTRHGLFYQIGAGVTAGTADAVLYGNASAILSHYIPIWGPFLFAARVLGSVEWGTVPYFDLQQAGTFEPLQLFGGESGVRGVPDGRYSGKIMALANLEIRTLFPRFYLLGQHWGIGATTFLDTGRVWAPNPTLDGTGAGLKFGLGAGFFIQWGEAAILRFEAAYSPDAVSENPSLPFGVYVSDGLMF